MTHAGQIGEAVTEITLIRTLMRSNRVEGNDLVAAHTLEGGAQEREELARCWSYAGQTDTRNRIVGTGGNTLTTANAAISNQEGTISSSLEGIGRADCRTLGAEGALSTAIGNLQPMDHLAI